LRQHRQHRRHDRCLLERSVPLSGEQRHVPGLDLRGIRLGAMLLVAGHPVCGDVPARKHADPRLDALLAATAWLLLDPNSHVLAVNLGGLPDGALTLERRPLAAILSSITHEADNIPPTAHRP
jgi:hypothetical protein